MSPTNGQESAGELNSPGWKLINDRWRWWDGEQYTGEWDGSQVIGRYGQSASRSRKPRPRASLSVSIIMVGLVLAAGLVMWWGTTRTEERPCEASAFTYTTVGGLWLPWLVLVVLVAFGSAISQEAAPGVRWVKVLAILGIVTAVVTFPGVAFFMGAANCSL